MELELTENLEIDIEWGRLAPALVVVLDRYMASFPSLKVLTIFITRDTTKDSN
jgi:hypothetical protein